MKTTIAQRIRELLAEGPSTSIEVASILGITTGKAASQLCALQKYGHVRTIGKMPQDRSNNT